MRALRAPSAERAKSDRSAIEASRRRAQRSFSCARQRAPMQRDVSNRCSDHFLRAKAREFLANCAAAQFARNWVGGACDVGWDFTALAKPLRALADGFAFQRGLTTGWARQRGSAVVASREREERGAG